MNLFIFLLVCYGEFIQQLVKFQGIKTRQQTLEDTRLVGKAFNEKEVSDLETLRMHSGNDIFKIKNNGELIACVSLKRRTYYKKTMFLWREFVEEIPAVEIYSLWVNNNYRGKGIARTLLYKSLMAIRKEYNYGNDFVVALHLNPEDSCMNISFALYYSMNFSKGTFVEQGPSDLQDEYERINYLHNPLRIILGYDTCDSKGGYFAMYTTFNQILFFNPIINRNLFKVGEILREILRDRRGKETST